MLHSSSYRAESEAVVKNAQESEVRRQRCRRWNRDRQHQRIGGMMRHGVSRQAAEERLGEDFAYNPTAKADDGLQFLLW
jgi:hypothetical protein